ncbi:MAG TPA: tyrosine-type recombinase/integrase [Acidimicrobiales bacterium]|nr:tyrosine-type recombinase/integrase [Acidimicrobiales bacterium]
MSEIVAADNGARVVQGALQTARHILSIAHGSGAIRHNPYVGVKVPRLERRDCVFLTAQILELADAITPPYGVLIKFAAYTGLRAGEIGGLRLRRLDLLRGQVDVVEALKDTSGRLHFGPTKNHLRRTVGLPRFLCDDLGVYLAGRNLKPDDLVFQSPTGSALRHHEFYRRYYKPAVRAAGLPDGLRFHDLRHTCARAAHRARCASAGDPGAARERGPGPWSRSPTKRDAYDR